MLRLRQPRLRPPVPLENPHVEAPVQVLPLVSGPDNPYVYFDVELFPKVPVHPGWSLLPLHHVHVQRLLRPDRHGHRHPCLQVHRAKGVRQPFSPLDKGEGQKARQCVLRSGDGAYFSCKKQTGTSGPVDLNLVPVQLEAFLPIHNQEMPFLIISGLKARWSDPTNERVKATISERINRQTTNALLSHFSNSDHKKGKLSLSATLIGGECTIGHLIVIRGAFVWKHIPTHFIGVFTRISTFVKALLLLGS